MREETKETWLSGRRGNIGGDQRSVDGIREMDGVRAAVGMFHKVEDAPNPACRAECFPNPKCSQPKCPPAWLPPECLPEECPPPKCTPPERQPPCCASEGTRRQITDSKIGRMRGDRRRKAVRVAMASHPK